MYNLRTPIYSVELIGDRPGNPLNLMVTFSFVEHPYRASMPRRPNEIGAVFEIARSAVHYSRSSRALK